MTKKQFFITLVIKMSKKDFGTKIVKLSNSQGLILQLYFSIREEHLKNTL